MPSTISPSSGSSCSASSCEAAKGRKSPIVFLGGISPALICARPQSKPACQRPARAPFAAERSLHVSCERAVRGRSCEPHAVCWMPRAARESAEACGPVFGANAGGAGRTRGGGVQADEHGDAAVGHQGGRTAERIAQSTGRENTLVIGNESTSVALSFPRCVLFSCRISSSVATHTPCVRVHTAQWVSGASNAQTLSRPFSACCRVLRAVTAAVHVDACAS
jgi:hypothetical protein